MSGSFYRGTSIDQDPHFVDSRSKLKKAMVVPDSFYQKVDFKKVNLEVMRAWVTSKVVEILGVDDDILVGTVIGFLETNGNDTDPRDLQIDLEPFLAEKTNAERLRTKSNNIAEAQVVVEALLAIDRGLEVVQEVVREGILAIVTVVVGVEVIAEGDMREIKEGIKKSGRDKTN
ncbi:serine/arginine regulated nuclear matrix protein, putative [Entamoeba invadens IP1]|uniref:serine/arginine regulated nuclear matrix protein, putative n=1 Tax=Entamoeba invadens IP1 TaxID=370355 RepID=UPI0002C3F864|nr:serine/arginine regulated nuclear matrix protein, putative [Entamoeba invadens IP1]ELP85384.1 serine/arginine regulated nuclear matrix protein, putative [Entamoeba invadens IP1]|eukprot:XP_004184730.1 serine/arginine regulated nuclear matrix protein, putative [Entamoeba invadens IP1]